MGENQASQKHGVIPPEEFGRSSGLEQMQKMIEGKLPTAPIAATLGYYLAEVSLSRAVFRGTPKPEYLNPSGSIHGGWAATLLDSALGCAVHTTLEKGEAYATAEFKVNLIRPITVKTGEVVCEGKVVHRGRTMAVSEATLKDANGKLLAIGTETCSIFPLRN
ncbi:MAG: PaaI family thioesterase [Rhizobiaceae bacterium]